MILFAMNDDVIPNQWDRQGTGSLRELRRLFYVGVTRSRRELYLVFQKGRHSPWAEELYHRIK